jgi:hypothetical protein
VAAENLRKITRQAATDVKVQRGVKRKTAMMMRDGRVSRWKRRFGSFVCGSELFTSSCTFGTDHEIY